jgi:hypothetical protein
VSKRAADLACADQRNLVTRHGGKSFGKGRRNGGSRGG